MKGLQPFQPDTYYHIVNHVVGNESLFRTDENYYYFMRRYAFYMPSVCDTLAYCLMPNHIHFLISTYSEQALSLHPKYKSDFHRLIMQQLSNLLNSYAKSYNKKYERKGALWIDYTKRFEINSDSYLTAVINYIHQNPVKHGFTRTPEDWVFSSFNSITSTKPSLLKREEVINWFGSRELYHEFHRETVVGLLDDWEY